MTIGVWLFIVGAVIFYGTKEFINGMRAKKGGVFHAPPVGYHAPSRIFLGWVIVLTVFNATGYAAMLGMKIVADQNANAFWIIGLFIGWLFITAFLVMPLALPLDYRRRQETGKANVGTSLLAFCCLGWMIAQFASIFSWVTKVS